MTNSEMKAERFLRWHKARVLVAKINANVGDPIQQGQVLVEFE